MGIPQDSTPRQFRQKAVTTGQEPKRRKVPAGPIGEALQRQRLHDCAKALGRHIQLQDDLAFFTAQVTKYRVSREPDLPSLYGVIIGVCTWFHARYKPCLDELASFTNLPGVKRAFLGAVGYGKWARFVVTLMDSVSRVPEVHVLAGDAGEAPPRLPVDSADPYSLSALLVPIVTYVSPGATPEDIVTEFRRQLPGATDGKLDPRILPPTQGRVRQHQRHVELYRLWLVDFGCWEPGHPQPPDSPSLRASFVRKLRAGEFDYSRVWTDRPSQTKVDSLLAGALEWLTPSPVPLTREAAWEDIFVIPF